MINNQLKEMILELCTEDNYGVWELYWNYQGLVGDENVDDELFINVVHELVRDKKIAPYLENDVKPCSFDVERLKMELKRVKQRGTVEGLYWFGLIR